MQKSEANENELNKTLQYLRFGNNIKGDQEKIVDVTNNQRRVSPNTATKKDKRVRETSPNVWRTLGRSTWTEMKNPRA